MESRSYLGSHGTYPESENVLIIWLLRLPSGILTGLVCRDEMHKVQRCIQQTEACLIRVGRLDLRQDFGIPFGDSIADNGGKLGSRGNLVIHVPARLVGGNPRDADSRYHFVVAKGEEGTDTNCLRVGRDKSPRLFDTRAGTRSHKCLVAGCIGLEVAAYIGRRSC